MLAANRKILAVTALAGAVGLAAGWSLSRAAPRPAQPPLPPPDPNAATAFPDLDPKNTDELFKTCPRMFGGKGIAPDPKDPVLVRLQKARLNAACAELQSVVRLWKTGALAAGEHEDVTYLCDRAIYAASDLYSDPKELRPWLEERVRVAKWAERLTADQIRVGVGRTAGMSRARFARLDAEIGLLRLIEQQQKKLPGK